VGGVRTLLGTSQVMVTFGLEALSPPSCSTVWHPSVPMMIQYLTQTVGGQEGGEEGGGRGGGGGGRGRNRLSLVL
jgi:hypothetical protein